MQNICEKSLKKYFCSSKLSPRWQKIYRRMMVFRVFLCNFVLMNEKLSSSLQWCRRYFSPVTVVCLVVLGFIIFSGEHTVVRSVEYDRIIDSLRVELEANRDTMLYYRDLNQRLSSDAELMEQVVREQYGMKRSSEDVYKFIEKK